jgi:protein translocase SEC61 complex gamma subunit
MEQEIQAGYGTRLKSFYFQCVRVWHVLRKPTAFEYKTVAKVSAIGVLVLGAFGFLIADVIKIAGRIFG